MAVISKVPPPITKAMELLEHAMFTVSIKHAHIKTINSVVQNKS